MEFSKPHYTKPIPEGTVKVFFYVIDKANEAPVIEFNFENESLRHKIGQSMRTNMFEKWIDRALENKLKVKGLLHLGTEFEYTRTVDVRSAYIYFVGERQDCGPIRAEVRHSKGERLL